MLDADDLATIAAACRDHEILRFDYRTNGGTTSRRTVEPLRLVHTGRLWYLVAWDRDRDDWRTFRVDRIDGAADRRSTGSRPGRRPTDDVAAFVSRGTAVEAYPVKARIVVHAPLARAAAHVSPNAGVLEARDEQTCTLHTGARSIPDLAHYLQETGLDFTVEAPAELRTHLATLAERSPGRGGAAEPVPT